MARVTAFARSRTGLLAVALLLAAGALTFQAPADARQVCGFQPLVITYYNDANHDEEVGQRGIDCDCDSFSWGTTSSYSVASHLCCAHNSC